MRSGRRIALDVGKARIGVAMSDFHSIVATPQPFIKRDELSSISTAIDLIQLHEAIEVYVGLPLNLKSNFTESTNDCLAFAKELQGLLSIDVRMVDERFTTTLASESLRAAGKNSISQRALIDSAAAAVILDTALEHEKATGLAAGIRVMDFGNEV